MHREQVEHYLTSIIWDNQRHGVCPTPQEQPLLDAALQCFRAPGPASLSMLEAQLVATPDALMRQCVLVAQIANAVLDEEGQQLAAIFAQKGKTIVCQAGCSRCCCQLVLCRPFEARLITAFLEGTPGGLPTFFNAYAAWDKATAPFRQSYLTWAEGFYGRGEDDGSHVVEDFQTPCPFLTTEGLCSIYPVRPYACRTYIALDPACPAPPPGHKGVLHMQYSLYTSHHASRQAVTDLLLRHLNLNTASVSMPEMVAAFCSKA